MGADTAPKAGDGFYLERRGRRGGAPNYNAFTVPPYATPKTKTQILTFLQPAIRLPRRLRRRECLPTTAHALPATTAVTTPAAASPVPIALATAKATAFAA